MNASFPFPFCTPILILALFSLSISGDFGENAIQMIDDLIRPGSLGKIQYKVNANIKEAKKRITPRGSSDIIVIRHANDLIRSTPLLVHFGNGLFRANSPRRWEKRVEMAITINGKRIEGGRHYRIRRNGRMRPKSLDLTVLEGKLGGGSRRRESHLVEFMVKDWKGRTVTLESDMYCWDETEKLVISDIDGTVTKSDMMGMIFKEGWIQPDIRPLYSMIKQNGYQLVYVSARPASTGNLTRKLLEKLDLPSGPLLLSSEPLGKALKTAVTDPERTKIRTLLNLKELFTDRHRSTTGLIRTRSDESMMSSNPPFHAAFGNQETDEFAYEMLNIPITFIVDQSGKIKSKRIGEKRKGNSSKSYRYLIDHLNDYFPPLKV